MHCIKSLTILRPKKCDKRSSSSMQFVPDWFVTSEQMWMWYDDYYDNDDGDHRDDENEDF